jgi:hypothetical protein
MNFRYGYDAVNSRVADRVVASQGNKAQVAKQ